MQRSPPDDAENIFPERGGLLCACPLSPRKRTRHTPSPRSPATALRSFLLPEPRVVALLLPLPRGRRPVFPFRTGKRPATLRWQRRNSPPHFAERGCGAAKRVCNFRRGIAEVQTGFAVCGKRLRKCKPVLQFAQPRCADAEAFRILPVPIACVQARCVYFFCFFFAPKILFFNFLDYICGECKSVK